MRIIIDKDNFVYPFKMFLNTESSDIPYSTEVEETTVSMPGVDGEKQVDNRYAAKPHTLVLRSPPDIDYDEKLALHNEINRFWVLARNADQEVFWERLRRTYYVRAVGQPVKPYEYASWIEFSLPLKAHDPFGYQDGEFTARGEEPINNRGNVHTPARIEFVGPVTDPAVTVNGTVYRYTGSIASGFTLKADASDYSVFMVNNSTSATANANINWNGNFLNLAPGISAVQSIENAQGKMLIAWRNRWA